MISQSVTTLIGRARLSGSAMNSQTRSGGQAKHRPFDRTSSNVLMTTDRQSTEHRGVKKPPDLSHGDAPRRRPGAAPLFDLDFLGLLCKSRETRSDLLRQRDRCSAMFFARHWLSPARRCPGDIRECVGLPRCNRPYKRYGLCVFNGSLHSLAADTSIRRRRRGSPRLPRPRPASQARMRRQMSRAGSPSQGPVRADRVGNRCVTTAAP